MRSLFIFALRFFDALKLLETSRRKHQAQWKGCMVYDWWRAGAWSCDGELCLYMCVDKGKTIVESWKGVWILN